MAFSAVMITSVQRERELILITSVQRERERVNLENSGDSGGIKLSLLIIYQDEKKSLRSRQSSAVLRV